MNTKKGVIGLLIFLGLFVGAWVLDDSMKKDHRTIKTTQIKTIQQDDPFQPREYIRIRLRSD